MTDLSFQSYNAIPDFFQTKLSPTFFYISKDKISKQTKGKNISLVGFKVRPIYHFSIRFQNKQKEKISHWQDSELGQSIIFKF
jgi:hypothetical protein